MNDKPKTAREMWKEGPTAFFSWFWEYHKAVVGLTALGIGILIWYLYTLLNVKPVAVSTVFMNGSEGMAEGTETALEEAFTELSGMDRDHYELTFDFDTRIGAGGNAADELESTSAQKLTAQVGAGELDLLVADASNFEFYAYHNMFRDLRELYSESELEAMDTDIYYVDMAGVRKYVNDYDVAACPVCNLTPEEAIGAEKITAYVSPDPSQMEEPVPVGIDLTGSDFLDGHSMYSGIEVIGGLCKNTDRTDQALQLLEFLYQK